MGTKTLSLNLDDYCLLTTPINATKDVKIKDMIYNDFTENFYPVSAGLKSKKSKKNQNVSLLLCFHITKTNFFSSALTSLNLWDHREEPSHQPRKQVRICLEVYLAAKGKT